MSKGIPRLFCYRVSLASRERKQREYGINDSIELWSFTLSAGLMEMLISDPLS